MEKELNLVSEWDKTFKKSDKVNHKKITFHNREGIIRRAVVHQNDLVVILRQGLHGGGDLRHHAAHRMLGAVARDHVRYFLHSCVLPSALTGAYRSPDPRWRRPAASFRPADGRQRGCRGRT